MAVTSDRGNIWNDAPTHLVNAAFAAAPLTGGGDDQIEECFWDAGSWRVQNLLLSPCCAERPFRVSVVKVVQRTGNGVQVVTKHSLWMLGAAVAAVSAMFLLISLVDDELVMGEPGTSADAAELSGPDQPDDDNIVGLSSGEDENEEEDDLWQANVGGTDFSGLGENNVGDVLFRGKLITRTFVDEDGNERSVEVCADIPEIEASKDYRFDKPGSDGIEFLLDFSTCTVSIASIEYGVVSEEGFGEPGQTDSPSLQDLPSDDKRQQPNFDVADLDTSAVPSWFDGQKLAKGNYALYRDSFAEETLPQHVASRVFRADIRAQVIAADGFGFALTETQLRMVYSAPNMNIISYFTSCDADSPAQLIRWIESWCYHGASNTYSNKVTGYVKGNYYAIMPHTSENARHRSSVSFSGYSNGYRGTCWWSDDLDHINLAGILTVRLRCDEQ